jgi:hypothetical protein
MTKQLKTPSVPDRVTETLKNFGLSENETIVYLAALKHEETAPYQLSKDTGIPRTTVYDVLLGLSLKGLVEMEKSDGIQKQQTRIRATNPSVLRSIIRERHQELNRIEVDVVDILPIIKSSFTANTQSSDFQYFSGIEGAKSVLFSEDVALVDEPIYAFDNLMPMDAFGKEAINEDVKKSTGFRSTSQTKIHELIPLTSWAKHVLSYQVGRDEKYLLARNIRFVDSPIFDQKMRIVIKGDRVRIACAHEAEAWGLVIKSQALSSSLLSIFHLLWMQATPVTLQMVRSWGKNTFLEAERRSREE